MFPGSLFSASIVVEKRGREERPWERGCCQETYQKGEHDELEEEFSRSYGEQQTSVSRLPLHVNVMLSYFT